MEHDMDCRTRSTIQKLKISLFWKKYKLPLQQFHARYSSRRWIGSQIIESSDYCNQTLLVPHYLNSTQNTSVNWIIRILLSLLYWPKVILLGGVHCTLKMSFLSQVWRSHLILLTDSVRIRSWRVKALNSANRAEGVLRPVRVERVRRQLLLHWKQK